MKHPNASGGITIAYCKSSGFAASAVNAAQALYQQLRLNAKLIPARGGIFEVAVAGKIVAKKSGNGFPGADDIVSAVAAALEVKRVLSTLV